MQVEVEMLELSANTSGRIDVEGKTEEIKAGANTDGKINAYEVEALEGSARANTGGNVHISVEDYLQASAGTGGRVRYRGQPKLTTRTGTGGKVKRDN